MAQHEWDFGGDGGLPFVHIYDKHGEYKTKIYFNDCN